MARTTLKHTAVLALTATVFAFPQYVSVLHERDDACTIQTSGAGPVPTIDTAEAFLAYDAFKDAALSVSPPSGYFQTFRNLQASNNADGYLGYSTLASYDVASCAAQCNTKNGCSSFNIYFERGPSINPGAQCPDPASTTLIKCVLWGDLVSSQNAVNSGQWRNKFHVVIAGSNGYVSNIFAPIDGFETTYLGSNAINAPLDCHQIDTYMGYKKYTLPYDPHRCAEACASQNEYNLAHPPSDGSEVRLCRYFNSYVLEKNGNPQEQVCSLYTKAWPKKFATNGGQWRGIDKYTISQSFAFTSTSVPAAACLPE